MALMKTMLLQFLTLMVCILRVTKSGGIKAVIAENLLLRQQLLVLTRGKCRCPSMKPPERIILAFCTHMISPKRIGKCAIGVAKATLLSLYRALVKKKYSRLFSNKGRRKAGRKGPSKEMIRFIVEIKEKNPRYGCPKIAMLASNVLGKKIDKETVRRILLKHFKPTPGSGPSWLSPIGNAPNKLFSLDLFRVESVFLRTYWVMLVMDQFSRRIIGFAVHVGQPNGGDICFMFNSIMQRKRRPKYLSSDNDPLFEYWLWKSNLEWLYHIEEIKTVSFVPFSHPFIERQIGSVRREFTDWILIWLKSDLEAKLRFYQEYFNSYRVHYSHNGKTPDEINDTRKMATINLENYQWKKVCGGMHHTPIAA